MTEQFHLSDSFTFLNDSVFNLDDNRPKYLVSVCLERFKRAEVICKLTEQLHFSNGLVTLTKIKLVSCPKLSCFFKIVLLHNKRSRFIQNYLKLYKVFAKLVILKVYQSVKVRLTLHNGHAAWFTYQNLPESWTSI